MLYIHLTFLNKIATEINSFFGPAETRKSNTATVLKEIFFLCCCFMVGFFSFFNVNTPKADVDNKMADEKYQDYTKE